MHWYFYSKCVNKLNRFDSKISFRKSFYSLIAFVSLICANNLYAQNTKADTLGANLTSIPNNNQGLSLQELQELLLQNNSQLRSASGLGAAAQFGVIPARTLDNPTINITPSTSAKNPLALGASSQMNWGISQSVPWPGKKQLSGDIAQAQANLTKEQVELLKVQLIGQLKSAWVAWQQNNAQISIARVQVDRLEQIKEIVRLRYANNAAAYVDFINAQVTQAQLRNDIIGFERQGQSLLAQIAVLIGQTTTQKLHLQIQTVVADKSTLDLKALQLRALEINPAAKASKFAVDAAQRVVELAELGKRPDFTLGLTSNTASPPWGFGNTDYYNVSLSATFPLYYAFRERNLIDQAKAQLISAQDANASVEQQIALQVEVAYLLWAQSMEQLKLNEERIVAQARVGYRLALTNYSNNQATYIDLLTAYNTLRSAELSQEQAKSSAVQAKINLDVAVGTLQN
jgi:outer membrane protein, heavy metal efflux system